MVLHHHERVDGLGYPEGLRGNDIPLGARIIKIADAFDTIVSERSYQAARTLEEALVELRNGSGRHFDPELIDFFIQSHESLIEPHGQASGEELVN
jgi:HD-GYP domain-containing protein (c-di-GMP phosphodiesterase class II)